MYFTDPVTGQISNEYTCQQSDVITSDKKALIKEYIMPFVTSILQYVLSVVPMGNSLILDKTFHEVLGRVLDNPKVENPSYMCREGIAIPSHLFEEGQPDTDFYLIVSSRPVAFERKVLADAYPCSHFIYNDEWGTYYGRPLVASINFNPGSLLLEQISSGILQDQFRTHQLIMLGLHEMIHALGFTANMYSNYVDEDGVRYSDVGPVITETRPGGLSVKMITSPRVVAFAQFHYRCPSLIGVELEGRDYGSHWEERIAGDELMSPLTTRVMPLSALTLALLQDSGWYQVNFEAAQRWRWGWHRGCDFVTKPCSESSWGDLFCSNEQLKCNQERTSKAQCNAQNSPANDAHLYYMDGCPTLKSFSNRGFCQDLTSLFALKQNSYGETFGDSSNCFDVRTESDITPVPACFQIRCTHNAATNKSQVVFNVFDRWYGCPSGDLATQETWVKISHPSLPSGTLQVTCPSYNFFCENEATEAWTVGAMHLTTAWSTLVVFLVLLFLL